MLDEIGTLLHILIPVIVGILGWQQKQIADNRKFLETLLKDCLEEQHESDSPAPKHN